MEKTIKKELRILILEDVSTDAELAERELRKAGIEFNSRLVSSREDFIRELELFAPDLILSDYKLPLFDGLSALEIAREKRPDTPFIFVTGALGEELVVEMRATDYVLKDRIYRLVPAVKRALIDADERATRKLAEAELKESEERFRSVFETANDAVICLKPPDTIYLWNDRAAEMFGYQATEIIGNSINIIIPEKYREKALEGLKTFSTTGRGQLIGRTAELSALHRDGTEFPIELSVSSMKIKGEWHSTGIIRDITGRRMAEDKLSEAMDITGNLLLISEAAANSSSVENLMDKVVKCTCMVLEANICLSYLWDKPSQTFRPAQASGLDQGMMPVFMTEALGEKLRKTASENMEVVVIPKAEVQAAALFSWLDNVTTLIALPLYGKKGPLGLIIAVYSGAVKASDEFIRTNRRLIRSIGSQVSVALEEATIYRESLENAIELSHKIENVQAMHEIDRSILSTLDLREILNTSVNMVTKIVQCERAAVSLVEKEKGGFSFKAGFGTEAASQKAFVPFEDTNAREVIATGMPQYIANLRELKEPLSHERELLREGFISNIRVPLILKAEVAGILSIGAKRPSAFKPDDLLTLERLALQVSVALENARLLEDLEQLFLGSIKALSSAIESSSIWTAGHSDSVTDYALDLGKKLGLSEKELKALELAGLLHDLGKAVTFKEIFDKTAKLTDEELSIIREHSAKSATIVLQVKQLKDIVPAVRYHHEFYNGAGYPEGLKGDNIPLPARILAVADAVAAMSADRPYREKRSMPAIVEELKKCSGTQFDPHLAELFIETLS